MPQVAYFFTVLRPTTAESHRSQGSAVMDSQGLCLKLVETISSCLKGSPDQSHFIFEINVGKRRIRHNTSTLKLNESFPDQLKIDWRFKFRIVLCRIRLFPSMIQKWHRLGLNYTLFLIRNEHFNYAFTINITMSLRIHYQ